MNSFPRSRATGGSTLRSAPTALYLAALAAALAGCGDETLECPGGTTVCGEICVDTTADSNNCGVCGTACGAGEVCSAGACALSCPPSQTECDGACFSIDAARSHCGSCGNACGPGEVCSAGSCAVSCASGLTDCSGSCRDLDTDRAHCGGCGNACASGQVCAAGTCEVSCADNQLECGGACTDVATDRANCGGCGMVCAADELCTAGSCELLCASGLLDCDGTCRDTAVDAAHCGACNNACGTDEQCIAGTCQLSCGGLTPNECAGACTNIDLDPANCGACGNVCGTGEVCAAGRCAGTCPPGATACDGSCIYTDLDPNHCGTCGNVCPTPVNSAPVCVGGSCDAVCAGSFEDCDDDIASNGCEADLSSSVEACGACGNVCPAIDNGTAGCAAGACGIAACAPGFDDCDMAAANGCEAALSSDGMNCGACGTICPVGEICQSGACVVGTPGGESCADPLPIGAGLNRVSWMASVNDYISSTPSCVSVGTIDGPDVVVTYTPSFTGTAQLRIENKPAQTRWVVLVSDATCGTVSSPLACLSDWQPTEFGGDLSVTASTTYYLYVADTTSGTAPLSNPFDLRVTELNCATFTSSVTSVSPAAGQVTSTLSPTVEVTFSQPVSRTSGRVTLSGTGGTSVTIDLSTSPSGLTWSASDRVLAIDPGTRFVGGETVTASVSGFVDTVCSNSVTPTSWTFDVINPPCTPGLGGLVAGSTIARSTGLSSFTEYYVAADGNANGFVYAGGTTALYQFPKGGGAPLSVTATSALGSTNLGYDMAIDGQSIFTLDASTSGTTGHLYRISTDGGATWSIEDWARFPQAPDDDLRSATVYGGRVYLLTEEDSSTVQTQVWSVATSSAAAPADARLELSFTGGDCTGLGVDDRYFYTFCAEGNDPLVRVDRSTGTVTTITEIFDASSTKNEVIAVDLDADGVADVLYLQTWYEEGYYVCDPAGPTPYVDQLFDFGGSSSNYGLGYDGSANTLWMIDDDNRDLIEIR